MGPTSRLVCRFQPHSAICLWVQVMVEYSTAVQLLLLVLLMVEVADLLLVSTFKVFQIGDSLA